MKKNRHKYAFALSCDLQSICLGYGKQFMSIWKECQIYHDASHTPDGLLSSPISQIRCILMCKFIHLLHADMAILTVKIEYEVFIFTLHAACIALLGVKTLEMSPRQLNISLISYLKMTSQGEVRDCLNWPLEWKIFSHIVRILFPFIWGRWKDLRDLLVVSSGEGEQRVFQAAKYSMQSRFREVLILTCILSFGRSFTNLIRILLISGEGCEIPQLPSMQAAVTTNFLLVYLRPYLWSYLVGKVCLSLALPKLYSTAQRLPAVLPGDTGDTRRAPDCSEKHHTSSKHCWRGFGGVQTALQGYGLSEEEWRAIHYAGGGRLEVTSSLRAAYRGVSPLWLTASVPPWPCCFLHREMLGPLLRHVAALIYSISGRNIHNFPRFGVGAILHLYSFLLLLQLPHFLRHREFPPFAFAHSSVCLFQFLSCCCQT